eukprot:NODE_117_length_1889_cov_449.499457_g81_i0.p1 GENE.NODE_117_length_1889_cov_449.499457_g81_i0~~NODE_117_length_1889_cov_449.499457_g81_i0.p1  ORF type:complete len:573 (-),score=255.07 NODE_117_length_1889_cov_449.499457_g81_i0:171-1847(-)
MAGYIVGDEVALRDAPPYLENAAIVGPTHSPVLDAMTTMEERERVEADYEWFRYSKFALAFLVFNLLLAVVLFCLTAWFAGSNLKYWRRGTPRLVEDPSKVDDNENGVPKYNRNLRISAIVIGFFGLLGIGLTMYLKPAPGARKGLYFLFAFLGLFVAGCIAGVAGAMDISNTDSATWCRSRERGTVPIERNCYSTSRLLTAVAIVDLAACFFLILTCVALCVAAAKSFAKPKREDDYNMIPKTGVSRSTREMLLILLFICFVLLVLMLVFTIVLHEGRDIKFADETFFVRTFNNDKPGWPIKNSRLRFAATTTVILVTLINLIPFRSRVFAYICAFIFFLCSALFLVCFALDVKAVDSARKLTCPFGFTCKFAPFIVICFFDIFLAIMLLMYVIFEFVARLLMECRHCTRSYGVFEIKKHEAEVCSSRPVRCEVCSKRTEAKDFVYAHRFDCGHDSKRCEQCMSHVPEWGYKKHQDECPKWPVKCSMCDAAYAREDMPAHTAACPMTPASCEACGETFRSRDMSEHVSMCSEMVVACTVCSERMPRYKLPTHQLGCY